MIKGCMERVNDGAEWLYVPSLYIHGYVTIPRTEILYLREHSLIHAATPASVFPRFEAAVQVFRIICNNVSVIQAGNFGSL